MRRFYYFGCRNEKCGHSLFGSQYNQNRDRLDNGFPVHLLDGTFTPIDPSDSSWRLTHLRYQGIVSILSCHDNTIDKRGGSNANFVVIDDRPWSAEEILSAMVRDFPDCVERLRNVPIAKPPPPRTEGQ